MNKKTKKIIKRAHQIIEIAMRMTDNDADYQVSNQIKLIQFHKRYCEKQFNADVKIPLIATGNWNESAKDTKHIIKRIEHLFEKLGVTIEWYDNVAICLGCSGLVSIVPDSAFWRPQYVLKRDGYVCNHCHQFHKA